MHFMGNFSKSNTGPNFNLREKVQEGRPKFLVKIKRNNNIPLFEKLGLEAHYANDLLFLVVVQDGVAAAAAAACCVNLACTGNAYFKSSPLTTFSFRFVIGHTGCFQTCIRLTSQLHRHLLQALFSAVGREGEHRAVHFLCCPSFYPFTSSGIAQRFQYSCIISFGLQKRKFVRFV